MGERGRREWKGVREGEGGRKLIDMLQLTGLSYHIC